MRKVAVLGSVLACLAFAGPMAFAKSTHPSRALRTSSVKGAAMKSRQKTAKASKRGSHKVAKSRKQQPQLNGSEII